MQRQNKRSTTGVVAALAPFVGALLGGVLSRFGSLSETATLLGMLVASVCGYFYAAVVANRGVPVAERVWSPRAHPGSPQRAHLRKVFATALISVSYCLICLRLIEASASGMPRGVAWGILSGLATSVTGILILAETPSTSGAE